MQVMCIRVFGTPSINKTSASPVLGLENKSVSMDYSNYFKSHLAFPRLYFFPIMVPFLCLFFDNSKIERQTSSTTAFLFPQLYKGKAGDPEFFPGNWWSCWWYFPPWTVSVKALWSCQFLPIVINVEKGVWGRRRVSLFQHHPLSPTKKSQVNL